MQGELRNERDIHRPDTGKAFAAEEKVLTRGINALSPTTANSLCSATPFWNVYELEHV